jgi:hypothetical protein
MQLSYKEIKMNKLFTVGGIALSMGIAVSTWAANPCAPIAQACMAAGYYKGGNTVGKGLIENCVMPVSAKTKTLANTNFSDEALKQCQATIAARMNQNKTQ